MSLVNFVLSRIYISFFIQSYHDSVGLGCFEEPRCFKNICHIATLNQEIPISEIKCEDQGSNPGPFLQAKSIRFPLYN